MVRSGASRALHAATLVVGAALAVAFLAVIRLAPRVDLEATGLGWAPTVTAAGVVLTATALAVAALVAGLRRGSVAALVGTGAAAAVAGAGLALMLTGSAAPMAVALPAAGALGGLAVAAARRRPAVPGRGPRTAVAAGGLIVAELAAVVALVPEVAAALEPVRVPLLLVAALVFVLVAAAATDGWQAAAGIAAALGAAGVGLDRDRSLELVAGLVGLGGAGLAGLRAALSSRPLLDEDAEAPERLPALAQHLTDGVLRFDGRLTLSDWNVAAARLLGLGDDSAGTRLEDLLGVTLADLPPDDEPRTVQTGVGGLVLRLHRAGEGVVAVLSAQAEQPNEDRLGRELRGTIEELLQARRTIDLQRAELERLATADPLTGVASRGAIIERLRNEIAQARRYAHPVAVVLLDVDDFAEINRRHGVAGGDALLREVALRMRLRVREADALGRAGSDGFLAVLPHTDEAGAATFADAVRRRLAQRPLPLGAELVEVTVSIGVAVMGAGETLDLDGLLARAGEALESARMAGGNRIALDRDHGFLRLASTDAGGAADRDRKAT